MNTEPASRGAAASAPEQGGAVTTRFSTAARIIADILMRFPASPAAIRAQVPLLTTRERIHVAQLAARLRDSIESSGLFYEAHLLRWRGGTFPLAQLLREPQMLWSGRAGTLPQAPPPPPGNAPAAAPPPSNAPAAPSTYVPVASAATGSPNPAAVASPGYGADGKPMASSLAGRADAPAAAAQSGALAPASGAQAVHPALEGVLRHQLDVLAAPVLRWEGAPWAGAFMALTLQPPPHQPERQHPDEEQRSRQDGDAPWQTRLTLRLAQLGEVKVNLRLGAQRVALDLQAEPDAAERMDAASDILRERLGALGFQNVALRIRPHEVPEGGHD